MIVTSSTKDIYDYIAFAGNLALVAVGVWGIIVALRSVRAAEKSAAAARDGAAASLLNARAVINAERPWLVVEATGNPSITLTMVNRGRTPAQVIWYNNFPSINYPVLGEKMNDRHYGFGYDQSGTQIMNIPMVFPDGKMEAGSFHLDSIRQGNPELWEEVRSMQKLLYLYSAIKYKGPFSEAIYETRYCFRVTSDGPIMAGDIGYNEHTESIPAQHIGRAPAENNEDASE